MPSRKAIKRAGMRTASSCSCNGGRAAGAEHKSCLRQGRAPLPYALSELIDNALRATQAVQGRRRIAITFATAGGTGAGASGLIAVWDNGARAGHGVWGHAAQQASRMQCVLSGPRRESAKILLIEIATSAVLAVV